MASPALIEYYIVLANEHRAMVPITQGVDRLNHLSKADQYERLAGLRNLFKPGA